MSTNKIILAGGSGFLGRALAEELTGAGHEPVILTRNPDAWTGAGRAVFWDGRTVGAWAAELEGARAVVNLAGKNVNCRYNEANLREINESRVNSVHAVARAIRACRKPAPVWVQTSSLAIYGDAGEHECDESAAPGQGIPVDTCLAWEGAFNAEATPGVRRVLLRISFVLGRSGGALKMLAGLTRAFLGGAIGSGRQYISWIHLHDMNRLFLRAIQDEAMSGVYNATGPDPVTNAEFMRELRQALHRPWSPPLPALLVPVGCFFLRTEPVLALTGRRGMPKRLQEEGFTFDQPKLRTALADIFNANHKPP